MLQISFCRGLERASLISDLQMTHLTPTHTHRQAKKLGLSPSPPLFSADSISQSPLTSKSLHPPSPATTRISPQLSPIPSPMRHSPQQLSPIESSPRLSPIDPSALAPCAPSYSHPIPPVNPNHSPSSKLPSHSQNSNAPHHNTAAPWETMPLSPFSPVTHASSSSYKSAVAAMRTQQWALNHAPKAVKQPGNKTPSPPVSPSTQQPVSVWGPSTLDLTPLKATPKKGEAGQQRSQANTAAAAAALKQEKQAQRQAQQQHVAESLAQQMQQHTQKLQAGSDRMSPDGTTLDAFLPFPSTADQRHSAPSASTLPLSHHANPSRLLPHLDLACTSTLQQQVHSSVLSLSARDPSTPTSMQKEWEAAGKKDGASEGSRSSSGSKGGSKVSALRD